MKTTTIYISEELPNRNDDESSYMELILQEGGDTMLMVDDPRTIDTCAYINLSNSDLNKLGKAIIEKLRNTPYKII